MRGFTAVLGKPELICPALNRFAGQIASQGYVVGEALEIVLLLYHSSDILHSVSVQLSRV